MELNHGHIADRWRCYRAEHKAFCRPVSVPALADIVLLILLFIMTGAEFVIRPGMTVELPGGNFVSGASYSRTVVVTLTQEGMIFFNDERTPIEGLKTGFEEAVHRQKDVTLTIESDARVAYGTIVEIMNIATEAGISKINMATNPGLTR